MSMCRGDREGYNQRPTGFRYVVGWEYESLAPCLKDAGFEILHHYYRPPGLPLSEQSWFVIVARK